MVCILSQTRGHYSARRRRACIRGGTTAPGPTRSAGGCKRQRSIDTPGPHCARGRGSMGRQWQRGSRLPKPCQRPRRGGRVQRPGASLGLGLGAPQRSGGGWGAAAPPGGRREAAHAPPVCGSASSRWLDSGGNASCTHWLKATRNGDIARWQHFEATETGGACAAGAPGPARDGRNSALAE